MGKVIFNSFGINEDAQEKWWQIWRKKKELQDRQTTYLAFIAGWNTGVRFNGEKIGMARRIIKKIWGK